MGNKTNPIGMRLITRSNWDDELFAIGKDYKSSILTTHKMKLFLKTRCKLLIRTKIKKSNKSNTLLMCTDKPTEFTESIVNNRIDLDTNLQKFISGIKFSIIKMNENAPEIICKRINEEIKIKTPIKITVRTILKELDKFNVIGLKASYSGRLYGIDIAQTVWHLEGRVPLSSISANIYYSNLRLFTMYGVCNIKAWVCQKIVRTRKTKTQKAVQGKGKENK